MNNPLKYHFKTVGKLHRGFPSQVKAGLLTAAYSIKRYRDTGSFVAGSLLCLSDKTNEEFSFVERCDDGDFTVSVLRDNSADINSFVEVRIRPDNPLHRTLDEKVSVLSMTENIGDEIDGLGYAASTTVFFVVIDDSLKQQILNQGN